MKRTILTIALLGAFGTAQANEWITLSRGVDGTVWSFKRGSGEFSRNDNGTPVYIALFQVQEPNGRFTYERKYVALQDCIDGYGRVVTVSTGSGSVLYSNDFAVGGNSVASGVGTAICLGAKRHAETTGQRY